MAECMHNSFLTLPGSLPFEDSDYSDFDELLTVPQGGNDFSLSSSSSAELFLPEIWDASAEATSSLSSPSSDATSRFDDLATGFPFLDNLGHPRQQQAPIAAPLPLGPSGLKLKLDFGSVASAWHTTGGGNPFQLRGLALTAATAAIPSTADLEASLEAASVHPSGASPAGSIAKPSDPLGAAAAEEARRKEAARLRDAPAKKAAPRKPSERKVVYPARKVSADKRPRIKGRFVTKAEFEQMLVVQTCTDRAVPALARA